MDEDSIKRAQVITGDLLCHARAVDNKLLVALVTTATQSPNATKKISKVIDQLLNHVTTCPNDGIIYRKIAMRLAAHSDAGYPNESKARSRANAHSCLSEDVPIPTFNGAVMTIAQIIKYVMSSSAKAALASLFITAKKCVEILLTLKEMGYLQNPTPIQVDNATAVGVVNNNVIPKQTKSMDMRL